MTYLKKADPEIFVTNPCRSQEIRFVLTINRDFYEALAVPDFKSSI